MMAARTGPEAYATPNATSHVRLLDGRRLAYACYGDPAGAPVLHFHGWPGAHLADTRGHEPGSTSPQVRWCPGM